MMGIAKSIKMTSNGCSRHRSMASSRSDILKLLAS
jgi:hypothetical protein